MRFLTESFRSFFLFCPCKSRRQFGSMPAVQLTFLKKNLNINRKVTDSIYSLEKADIISCFTKKQVCGKLTNLNFIKRLEY
jgi:hypothetical protein